METYFRSRQSTHYVSKPIIVIIVYYANKAAYMTHTYKTHTQTHKDKNTQDKIHNALKYAISNQSKTVRAKLSQIMSLIFIGVSFYF